MNTFWRSLDAINGKKGLIDAHSEVMFDHQLETLQTGWDQRFSNYFDNNIKADMKLGMLLPIREYLGIDRYYNNGNECMNKKIQESGVRVRSIKQGDRS